MGHINPIQLQKFLKGVDYPAHKDVLLDTARKHGADDNVTSSLEQLPDEEFRTPAEVSQAIGRLPEEGGTQQTQRKAGQGKLERQASKPAGQGEALGIEEFLTQALQDCMAEIEICELALERSSNDEIKMFAQRMIDEHGRMGMELEKAGGKRSQQLATDLDSEHNRALKSLSGMKGEDFDREFIAFNIREHEQDVKVFQHYERDVELVTLRNLASRCAERMEQHLNMARKMGERMGLR